MSNAPLRNTLVSIGSIGTKTCYLNVNEWEARRRYCEANPDETINWPVSVLEFTDEFYAYEVGIGWVAGNTEREAGLLFDAAPF